MSESAPDNFSPDRIVVEVVRKKKREHVQRMLTAVPRSVYYVVFAIIALILLVVIIIEPFANEPQLPYYHPPGTVPDISPLRR